MKVDDFEFKLPHALIAQVPVQTRDQARLLVLDRAKGISTHTSVSLLADHFQPGDVLALNNTKVFPARLYGHRIPSGGSVKCLLIREINPEHWDALVHPGQKLGVGEKMLFEGNGRQLFGEVVSRSAFGRRTVRLWSDQGDPWETINVIGHIPLPPYIKRPDDQRDRDRYQTVYARTRGSVAAPTAGLHFTTELFESLASRNVIRAELTLHVGYGTFKPLRTDRVEDHMIEAEPFEISEETAHVINRALDENRRVIAVGTTTTRALETSVRHGGGRIVPGKGVSDLFIYPGFSFAAVSGIMTNFHLPKSSLLMLVSAFAGRDCLLAAYDEAVRMNYRFYSYGDAMLIV